MALDFTALKKIAYRGFETLEEQEQKDKLIDQGFTIVENASENPFLQASEPLSSSTLGKASSTPGKASERVKKALERASDSSDYKRMYRAAHDFHQRHNPPVIDREYWRTHEVGIDGTPELEVEYWENAAEDIARTANAYSNDPFIIGLLATIYSELGREYQALRNKKQASEAD